ncbi:unnamed protein product, partial [Ectocarpus fasciculatus]
ANSPGRNDNRRSFSPLLCPTHSPSSGVSTPEEASRQVMARSSPPASGAAASALPGPLCRRTQAAISPWSLLTRVRFRVGCGGVDASASAAAPGDSSSGCQDNPSVSIVRVGGGKTQQSSLSIAAIETTCRHRSESYRATKPGPAASPWIKYRSAVGSRVTPSGRDADTAPPILSPRPPSANSSIPGPIAGG